MCCNNTLRRNILCLRVWIKFDEHYHNIILCRWRGCSYEVYYSTVTVVNNYTLWPINSIEHDNNFEGHTLLVSRAKQFVANSKPSFTARVAMRKGLKTPISLLPSKKAGHHKLNGRYNSTDLSEDHNPQGCKLWSFLVNVRTSRSHKHM